MSKSPTHRAPKNTLALEVDRLLRQLPGPDRTLRDDPEPEDPRDAGREWGTVSDTFRAPVMNGTTHGAAHAPRHIGMQAVPGPARRPAGEPSVRAQQVATWMRALLAAGLGIAVSNWPYASACGWRLYLLMAVLGVVFIAGGWASLWSWRTRSPIAHIVSLFVIYWGVVLAAEQVLPRIGYAAVEATWRCIG